MTPLHWACKRNDSMMVEFLLHFEPDAWIKDILERTPYDIADKNNCLDAICMLRHYMERGERVKDLAKFSEFFEEKRPESDS